MLVVENFGLPLLPESSFRAFTSASVTLTLGILGSSVLPIAYSFSRTGVLSGLCAALVVALANALSCTLLLRAAAATQQHTYEGVAEAAGGRFLASLSSFSLFLLLFGTLCGDFALLAGKAHSFTLHAVLVQTPTPLLKMLLRRHLS